MNRTPIGTTSPLNPIISMSDSFLQYAVPTELMLRANEGYQNFVPPGLCSAVKVLQSFTLTIPRDCKSCGAGDFYISEERSVRKEVLKKKNEGKYRREKILVTHKNKNEQNSHRDDIAA